MKMVTATLEGAQGGNATAKSVFIAWELLRLVFNAALVVVVILASVTLINRTELADPRFWRFLAKAAVGANVCFCAGPVVEGYLLQAGIPRRVSRLALFFGGLIVSMFLAFGCIATWGWGEF